MDQQPESYYDKRLAELGITPELNQVMVWHSDNVEDPETKVKKSVNVLKPVQVFRRHEKGIEIIVYSISRDIIRIEKDGSRYKKDWTIIRHEKPLITAKGDSIKYQMPKGQGSYPFFPPALLDKYDQCLEDIKERKPLSKPVETLFLTEGFFKAFKGSMHGMDIIGLPSITHLKDKDNKALHEDILKLKDICGVKRFVWLVDGDCLDLSQKVTGAMEDKERIEAFKKVDLYTRPSQFYSSIVTFKQLLDDHDVDKYFMHINADEIINECNLMADLDKRITRDQVKGLDDLLCSFPEEIPEIIADAHSVSKRGRWFAKFNVANAMGSVRKYFNLGSVNDFYHYHADRQKVLKGMEFVFHGTRYRYNDQKNECEIVVPGEASNYFRVGDQYYKFAFIPNKYGQLERRFLGRMKGTIVDDHGKEFVKHIPKYEGFCNVPDHVNHQPVIKHCFNVYSPLDFVPEEEECTGDDCPTILGFIKHIFGLHEVHFTHPKTKEKRNIPQFELGLDYMQVLYQKPWEKLPILCLVSQENNTGKSTLGKLFKQIFSGNCAIVGNQDLAGDFNSHWVTKLLVICDETKIDKQHVIEKVKSLSTADKIMMNAKGRDHVEFDCFIKFMFITNNEKNFIHITDDDIRYWVIKVPVIKEENPNILEKMIEEIPAFLSFLSKRKLQTEKLNRMWFYPSLLKTEALKRVVQFSRPTIEKELRDRIKNTFLDFGVTELKMALLDVKEEFFKGKNYELNYIKSVLEDNLKVETYHEYEFNGKDYKTQQEAIEAAMREKKLDSEFEALRFVKKKKKTHRYTYPVWTRGSTDGEQKRTEIKCNSRPYIFKRSDFVPEDEEVEVDAENKHINEMSSDGVPQFSSPAAAPGSQENLPF